MMEKIGLIGVGNLGRMLLGGLISKGGVKASQVYIYNRTLSKAEAFQKEFPEVHISSSNQEVIKNSDLVFLCVKAQDLKELLSEIGTRVPEDKIFVSTLLSPPLWFLSSIMEGKLIRIYPSITQSTGYGITLTAFSNKISLSEQKSFIHLMDFIGKTLVVPEEQFRTCGDITSCGPAFISYMVGSLAKVGIKHGLSKDLAQTMAQETLLGTALLLKEKNISFEELVSQVATPGGCTREGLNVLEDGLEERIEKVFEATLKREKAVFESLKKEWEKVRK